MSQDLFAAFGAPEVQHSTPNTDQTSSHKNRDVLTDPASPFELLSNLPSNHKSERHVDGLEDEDDFGDFEDASQVPQNDKGDWAAPESSGQTRATASFPPKASNIPFTKPADARIGKHPFAANMDLLFSADDEEYDAGDDDLEDLSKNPEAAMAYSKRIIRDQLAEQASIGPHPSAPPIAADPAGGTRQTPGQIRPVKDPNVLFDADDITDESEEDDDDFGDFEDAPAPGRTVTSRCNVDRVRSQSTMPSLDLLGLDEAASRDIPLSHNANRIQPSVSHSTQHEKMMKTAQSHQIRIPTEEDDAWDDFEEADPVTDKRDAAKAINTLGPDASKVSRAYNASDSENSVPPTNVPPPAILLSMFLSIFTQGRETLLDPASRLDPTQRQQLLAHPATAQFLKGYLNDALVLGHIIAGRKLRWKRDQHLAQSMRIGPAAAGGRGGMKLAGVDKAEVTKEDREVLESVRLWKAQVGKLRVTVMTAGSTNRNGVTKLPLMPEIAEQMPVKTLKATEGGFVAPQACALCGLKREERVSKVDVNVDDSFGEWWVEGMSMHSVCRTFWLEYKDKLRSR